MPPRPLTVYVLASRSRALYVGVTNDLGRRLAEHRAGEVAHTARYRVDRLVRAETYGRRADALAREKQLKGWRRSKKVALVESENPTWRDLDPSRYGGAPSVPPAGRGPRSDGTRRDPSTPLRSAQDDGGKGGAGRRGAPSGTGSPPDDVIPSLSRGLDASPGGLGLDAAPHRTALSALNPTPGPR